LVEDGNWRDKLRAEALTAVLPTPNQVRAKDIEALGKVLRSLLEEEIALAWIAFAYLSMKGSARLRSVEGLLLEGAATSDALLDALSRGMAAIEATTNPVPKVVISRAITAVEKYAETRSSRVEEAATPDLAAITARASRAELARLVSAVLSLRDTGELVQGWKTPTMPMEKLRGFWLTRTWREPFRAPLPLRTLSNSRRM
jgi:hypothetical protein